MGLNIVAKPHQVIQSCQGSTSSPAPCCREQDQLLVRQDVDEPGPEGPEGDVSIGPGFEHQMPVLDQDFGSEEVGWEKNYWTKLFLFGLNLLRSSLENLSTIEALRLRLLLWTDLTRYFLYNALFSASCISKLDNNCNYSTKGFAL